MLREVANQTMAVKRIGAAVLAVGVLALAFGGVVTPELMDAAVYAGQQGSDTGELLLTGYGGALAVLGAATGGTAFAVGAAAAGV